MSSNFLLYHATLSVLAQTKLVVRVFMRFWGAVHNLGSKGIRGGGRKWRFLCSKIRDIFVVQYRLFNFWTFCYCFL